MTPKPMPRPPCTSRDSSFGFRHSFVIPARHSPGALAPPTLLGLGPGATAGRISGFVILLTALLAAGCFSPRPDFYRLRGRILDAETGRGLGDARLRLRAAIATGLGPRVFSAYGITAPDGTYELELGEGYDALRLAGRIRLDVGKTGYATGGAEIPPPARKQKAYAAPNVVL